MFPMVICIVMTIGSVGTVWASHLSHGSSMLVLASDPYKKLIRLDEIASSLYIAAYTNNRQSGYNQVQQLQGMLDAGLSFLPGYHEGWALLEGDAQFIRETLLSGTTRTGWLLEAARIRLATDALIRQEHALWLQYERLMQDDMLRVQRAWKRPTGDGAVAARAAMNSLQEHHERIAPTLALLYGSHYSEEMKERIRYTNQLLEATTVSAANEAMVNHSLKALNESITRLFDQNGRREALPAIAPFAAANPVKWTLFLGAVISAVLAYSGWRKYKADPFGVKPLA